MIYQCSQIAVIDKYITYDIFLCKTESSLKTQPARSPVDGIVDLMMVFTGEGVGWQSGYRERSRAHVKPSRKNQTMKIFRVIGIALFIVILRALAPSLWDGIESTLLMFFKTLQTLLSMSTNFAASGPGIWIPQ